MKKNKTLSHFQKNHVDSHHWLKFETIMLYETTMKAKLAEMISRKINMKTRLLVEKLYKITVEQQFAMEKYLNEQTVIGPLDIPFISDFCNPDQQKMWDLYSSVRETEGL